MFLDYMPAMYVCVCVVHGLLLCMHVAIVQQFVVDAYINIILKTKLYIIVYYLCMYYAHYITFLENDISDSIRVHWWCC